MAKGYISKTAFLKFEQCHKAFYLYKNHYYLRDKLSTEKQLTFKRGIDVGVLAQQLFPGGINVVENDANKENAVQLTQKLIADQTPVIYEATFVYNDVLVMVDILVLTESGYEIYEVKSSLKITEFYIKDVCLQYYVLNNCIKKIKDVFIVTLNEGYVFKDQLELKQLFKRRSVLKEAEKNYNYFETQIQNAQLILEKNQIPNEEIGKQCFSPYECDFFGTCWKDKFTKSSVFNIGKVSKEELFLWYNRGIKNIEDIPEDESLKHHVKLQVNSFLNNEKYADIEAIILILKKLKEPYAAIDMEIWNPAVPQINGTKPFQKLPFLCSLYSLTESENVFLNYENDDRKEFATQLLMSTEKYNSILVYDKSMEQGVINELIELFPEMEKALKLLLNKIIDLSEIIHKHYFYHPDFNGNFSLKDVSKAILHEDVFSELKITSGLEAMNFFSTYREENNPIEKQLLKDNLEEYCQADARSTFFILQYFQQLIKAE